MRHMVLVIDVRMTPGQEGRYRETRGIPEAEDVRSHVVHEIGQDIAGTGALDDVWTSTVRGRPEEA